MEEKIQMGLSRALLLRPFPSVQGSPLFVGLSGGIGVGKSSVGEVWRALGANVFSADEIARDVVAPETPGLDAVVSRFGTRVLSGDGALDRAALAKIVFDDEDERLALEAITHPLIEARMREEVALTPPGGIAVYDVPLLVEKGMAEMFDVVVMVHAPLLDRLDRLEKRGLTNLQARRRMAVQAAFEARKQVSNIWVDNAGDRHDLSYVSRSVYEAWLTPAAEDSGRPASPT